MDTGQPFIGHVHLKVSDLERSLEFYINALGFEVQQKVGSSAAFLSFGGYHHHLGLNTWSSLGGDPPARGSTGLFHFAIVYPSRAALSVALKRAIDYGISIEGAADHGVSQAIYFRDPDGNGIELYWDRPIDEWPRSDGEITMATDPLDLDALLLES